MVGAEDNEKYIAYDYAKKNTKRAKKIEEYPQNICYHCQLGVKLERAKMCLYAARECRNIVASMLSYVVFIYYSYSEQRLLLT